MSSGHALYFYEVLWNYLERYQSYRADTISKRKITKGNNCAKNVGAVIVVNLWTSSGHALHFYQVSWNYLERYQSYTATWFHYWKLQRGIIPQKMQVEWPLLISASPPVMLYICAKFCDIISNGIKIIKGIRFVYWKLQRGIMISLLKITKGNNSTKNASGVTIGNHCKSSSQSLYLYQVLWNYLKRYQSYKGDTLSILKITKGIILQKM